MTQYGLLLSISSSAYSHGLGQASQFSSNRLCEKKLASPFFFFNFFFLPPSKLQVSSLVALGAMHWSVFTAGCTLSHISLTASLHWTFMQLPWPRMQTSHLCIHITFIANFSNMPSLLTALLPPSPTLTSLHTPPFFPLPTNGPVRLDMSQYLSVQDTCNNSVC